MKTLTVTAALAVAPAAALAQSQPSADHGYGTGTVSGNVSGDPSAGLPVTQSDVDEWMRNESVQHNGVITRRAYFDYLGRRWDAIDTRQQGLTPSEVSRLTGHVDSSAPAPLTGTGEQPGNMGPGNAKGK
jgi:hypothetical protein